jgi:hypothetical protein
MYLFEDKLTSHGLAFGLRVRERLEMANRVTPPRTSHARVPRSRLAYDR